MKTKELKTLELIGSSFFILFTLFFLYVAFTSVNKFASRQLKGELAPMDVPKVVLFIMLILSIVVFVSTVRWFVHYKRNTAGAEKDRLMPKKTVVTLGMIAVYTGIWNVLGFTLSTFIYFAAQSKFLEPDRSLKQVMLTSACFTLISVLLFHTLFHISFPEPLFDLIAGS